MAWGFAKELLLYGFAGFEGQEQFSFDAQAWQELSVGDNEGFAFGLDKLSAETQASVDFGVMGHERESCFVGIFCGSIQLGGGGKAQVLAGKGEELFQALANVLQVGFELRLQGFFFFRA